MLKLTFIDTEAAWDEHLHEDYASLNRRKHKRHRMSSKRIFAAAALSMHIGDDGTTSIQGLQSWTEHGYGDEAAVVEALLDHLRYRPDDTVITWGGLAADLPLITMAAMEHQLVLPPQLRFGQRVKFGELMPHTDLALTLKDKGRDWAHMSELALRMGVPRDLLARKSEVPYPLTVEDWEAARIHVELDTVLTALVALPWLRAQGRIRGDTSAIAFHLADWFGRMRAQGTALAEPMRDLRRRMMDRIERKALEVA
ncbi:hypothetical protein [Qipengyuania sediminis]|uniref:hypothetical protein n=1 Tax=Qipengyuania sediminis TaxID=1532023 RepID=UPI0014055342|nr:hypothetical protein [Qipengyuania sediminis]